MRMSIVKHTAAVLLMATTLAAFAPNTFADAKAGASHGMSSKKGEIALRLAMQKLWQDHVLWTRLVIVSTAAGLPDLEPTTQRLLQNQTDIGNAVKPYFGDEAGNKLTELLRTHILGAAEVLGAAKVNDSAKLEAAKTAWYANADEIAVFLSAANPKHWPVDAMKKMMRDHLDLTLTEAVDQLQGRYAQSVADYDRVQDEILRMAEMLSDGIIKQFPKKV